MRDMVALIELGSNAVRLLLARINPGKGFRILDEARVQTRLGSGRPGTLPHQAVDHTVRAVHRFLVRARNGHDPRVLAVATSAVRDAADREGLLGPLRKNDGVEVTILTGQQEARLGALAVRWSLPIRDGIIADLGGGSLQLTRLRHRHIASIASVPLGAVRMTRRFLQGDPPTTRELRALRGEIRARLLDALPAAGRGEEMVGLGGTVRTLARLRLEGRGTPNRPRHGLRLKQSDVTAVRERLEPLTLRERRRLRGLKTERADILLAGAIVIEEAMTFGGYLTLTVCTHGVRDGLLLRETFTGED